MINPSQYTATSIINCGVLHVVPGIDPSEGGVVASVNSLARSQHSLGINVTVFTTYKKGKDLTQVHELENYGIEVYRIGPIRSPVGHHTEL